MARTPCLIKEENKAILTEKDYDLLQARLFKMDKTPFERYINNEYLSIYVQEASKAWPVMAIISMEYRKPGVYVRKHCASIEELRETIECL